MNLHQNIIKGIKEQLFLNNYLVIPGFGGFVLKKIPSHFSNSGGMILPPSKTISFNAQLKQNDGVLVHWLMSSFNCSNEIALQHLTDFSEYCKSILNNKGRLSIDGLGFFYTDFENNICFEPQQQTNYLTSSFGLGPVALKEIEPEVEVKTETIFVDRVIKSSELETKVEPKRKRNYGKIAIAAVTGIIVFSALLIIVSDSKISGQLKASITGKEQKLLYTPINYSNIDLKNINDSKKDYVADMNGIAPLELDNNKTIAVKAIESIAESTSVTSSNVKRTRRSGIKNYEVVLGCFSILNNANNMVKKLQAGNVEAIVSGQNEKGLYVVSSGGFETKDEAIVELTQLKNTYPNAWIKKSE